MWPSSAEASQSNISYLPAFSSKNLSNYLCPYLCLSKASSSMFSPTLAHFEPLHIGFNMMSLHTLGLELEDGYGSIVFFVYNVALIIFTTVVSHSRCAVFWCTHALH